MPTWNELLADFQQAPNPAEWLTSELEGQLADVGRLRGDRNVILYGSAFLQKPSAPGYLLMITAEDLNGFMGAIQGMDCSKGLTLILHTPGGVTNAAETLVKYLREKFDYIEVVVPALAMSAGTMMALAADRIVMGRQSQLGPIDPQLTLSNGQTVSARAIVDQFKRARTDVLADERSAHLWAPVVATLGPSLLEESRMALGYSERMVAHWLSQWMLDGDARKGKAIAKHFNDAKTHKSHGRRIDRAEARLQGVVIDDLEDEQELQEAVLTTYHLMTILVEHSPTVKLVYRDKSRNWLKNHGAPVAPGPA